MFARPVKLGGRGSHGSRQRESSEWGPLIYGVSPFSGDVDCCSGFVSAQEVRASEAENERDVFF